MSSQEDVTFKLLVDGSQAQRGLNDTRAAAVGLGGGLDRVVGGLDKVGGKVGADARQAVGALGFAMGGAANQGSQLLNTVGDIAGALAGGPWTIALVAGTAVVAGLASEYKAAEANSKIFRDSVDAIGPAITRLTQNALEPGRKAIFDMREELRNFGKDARQIAIDAAQGNLENNERALSRVTSSLVEKNQQQQNKEGTLLERVLRKEVIDRLIARRKELEEVVKESRAQVDDLTRTALELDARDVAAQRVKDAPGNAKRAESAAEKAAREGQAALDKRAEAFYKAKEMDERFYNDALLDIEEGLSEAKRELWAQDREIRLQLDELELKDALAKRDKQIAIAKEVSGYSTQAMGIGVGATQVLIDEMITGQEKALEHFAINVSRQAGSALIGHGINLGGAAVVSGLTGNLPLAAIQGAGAAGLVGAGLALGGVATGIEHTIAGGRIGSAAPDRSARDPGVNRGRGGSLGNEANGTFQIVVNYGVAGPAPEDTARAVAKANRTAARRGIG